MEYIIINAENSRNQIWTVTSSCVMRWLWSSRLGGISKTSLRKPHPRFKPLAPAPWFFFFPSQWETPKTERELQNKQKPLQCIDRVPKSQNRAVLSVTSSWWHRTERLHMGGVWRGVSVGVTGRGLHLLTVTGCITPENFPWRAQRNTKEKERKKRY